MACISIAQGGRKFKAEPKNVAANIAANILNSTDEMAIAFMNSFQKEWPILADTGFTTALDMADTYGITIPYIRGILSSTGITKNDVIRRFVKRTSSDYLLYNLDQLVKAGKLKSAIICEGSACGQESGYHHICMIDNENKKFNVTVCRNNNFNIYSPRVFLAVAALIWAPGRHYFGNDFSRKVFEKLRDSKEYGYVFNKAEAVAEPASPVVETEPQQPDIKAMLAVLLKDVIRDVVAEMLPELRPEPQKQQVSKPVEHGCEQCTAGISGEKRSGRYEIMPKNFDRVSRQYLNGDITASHGAKLTGMSHYTFIKYATMHGQSH